MPPCNPSISLILFPFVVSALSHGGSMFLVKSKETFQLSDMFALEARCYDDSAERLLLDYSTGSNVFRTTCDRLADWPRCDWIGRVLARAQNGPELVQQVSRCRHHPTNHFPDNWTLDYTIFTHEKSLQPKDYTKKTILYAMAQAIHTPAALNPNKANARLLLVDVDRNGVYIVQLLSTNPSITQNGGQTLSQRWLQRPFRYSAAMNPTAAEIIVSLLQRHFQVTHLLDPTCGSGTFLAHALARNMTVLGWDCKEKCVKGTRQNLESVVGRELVHAKCRLEVRDSTLPCHDLSSIPAVGVACNLPWGLNTLENHQNEIILAALRQSLPIETPCVFVSKENNMNWSGYRVLEQIHIPSRAYGPPQASITRRNHCVVTLTRTTS